MTTSTTSKLLKLTSPSTTSSYYLKDRKQVWDYDPQDKTSPASDTVLIGYGGKRFKLAGSLAQPPIVVESPIEPPVVTEPPVIIEPTNIILVDASTLGIKSDGVTDNGPALRNFVNTIKGKKELYQLNFQPGTVKWNDASWIYGARNLHLTCKTGIVSFTCPNFFMPFNNGGLTTVNIADNNPFGNKNPGYLFKKIAPDQIQILEAAILPKIAVGHRLFLMGYETQGQGAPPNPRFKEVGKIKSITNNVVQFEKPIKDYNTEWKDWLNYEGNSGWNIGKPRAYVIEDTYPEYIKISNAKILNGTGNSAFKITAENLILDNVDFTNCHVWHSENMYSKTTNCFNGGWEIDKIIGTLEIIDCKPYAIAAATGVDNLRLINVYLNDYTTITPSNLYGENCFFGYKNSAGIGSLSEFEWWTGMDTWTLKNNTFEKSGPVVGRKYEFTAMDYVNGNIILPNVGVFDDKSHWPSKLIYHGSTIWSKDGTASAVVKDIIFQNGNYVLVLTGVKGTITKGMIMQYKQIKNITDLGGNKLSDGQPIVIK